MKTVRVAEVMGNSKFSGFHMTIFFWCAFSIICDGYDLNMYGVVLPTLMAEWSLTSVEAGAMGSYALFGMMVGAFLFAPLADMIGRKKVLILCLTLFSAVTFLIAFSPNPTVFSVLRFIAGLGLGGLMPNVIAMMTEYSPKSKRNILVATMYSGYAIGGIIASLIGIYLIPTMGWNLLFILGGLPLLAIPIMIKKMPESLNYYVQKEDFKTLAAIMNKVDPTGNYHETDRYVLDSETEQQSKETATKIPVQRLFEDKRARSTFMFWVSCFSCLIMVYGLNTWLPKLMMQAGYPLGSSLTFMLVLNFGSIVGSVVGGWLADRIGAKKVLLMFYALGALCFILLGFKADTLILYFLIAIGGACSIGTQNLANPYIAEYYPKNMRATGIGWSLGIGRIGGILGPTLVGYLVAMNLPFQMNFLAFAIPCLFGALAIFLVQEKYSSYDRLVETKQLKESVS
ncbi:MFS transporter [Brevibacillus daliensis]|uniref:MFS transporter n=1 Tax=Brevibacillus daliensis TaxID=2892995 RepID=UPI001E4A982B|nr:aromatic acid/H+ symport family MFS transporter [Brevibacillus daliensis]